MLAAITRGTSPSIADCTLTYLSRMPIDVTKAIQQQNAYERCLMELGVRVISLGVEDDLPDSVFVQDTAVVLDEVAILAAMGVKIRQPEIESVAKVLSLYREVKRLNGPASLEGGDMVRIGNNLYIGLSGRTNSEGIAQLQEILRPFRYQVKPVEVRACIHLSTGCAYLGQNTVLVNRSWVNVSRLEGVDIIEVPESEPWAANVLSIGDVIIMSSSFSETRELLTGKGFQVRAIDISEFEKAEGSLTCLSLLLDIENTERHSLTDLPLITS